MELYLGLGLTIKLSKSVLSPSRCLEHLGMNLDFVTNSFSLPERKRHKARTLADALLASYRARRRLVPRSTLLSTAGYFSSLCVCLPFGRFYLAPFYTALSQTPHHFIPLSSQAVRFLR